MLGLQLLCTRGFFPTEMLTWICFSSTCYTTITVTRFMSSTFTLSVKARTLATPPKAFTATVARMLELWVHIPLEAGMCVCVCVCVAP